MSLKTWFLDFILDKGDELSNEMPLSWKQKRRWKATPTREIAETLLDTTKAITFAMVETANRAIAYSEQSTQRANHIRDLQKLETILGGILNQCQKFTDTAYGDKLMREILELIGAQFVQAQMEVDAMLGRERQYDNQ